MWGCQKKRKLSRTTKLVYKNTCGLLIHVILLVQIFFHLHIHKFSIRPSMKLCQVIFIIAIDSYHLILNVKVCKGQEQTSLRRLMVRSRSWFAAISFSFSLRRVIV